MALRAVRKMCAVIPHHLGKGGPLRASRCIPPGSWHAIGIEPCRASEPYRRFITRGEISLLPAEGMPSAPIDMKGVSPPFMASTRQTWSLPAPPAPGHGETRSFHPRRLRRPSELRSLSSVFRTGGSTTSGGMTGGSSASSADISGSFSPISHACRMARSYLPIPRST